jgi:hypothetical protein
MQLELIRKHDGANETKEVVDKFELELVELNKKYNPIYANLKNSKDYTKEKLYALNIRYSL